MKVMKVLDEIFFDEIDPFHPNFDESVPDPERIKRNESGVCVEGGKDGCERNANVRKGIVGVMGNRPSVELLCLTQVNRLQEGVQVLCEIVKNRFRTLKRDLSGVRLGGFLRVIRELQIGNDGLQVRGHHAGEGKRVWLFGCAFWNTLEQEQLARYAICSITVLTGHGSPCAPDM